MADAIGWELAGTASKLQFQSALVQANWTSEVSTQKTVHELNSRSTQLGALGHPVANFSSQKACWTAQTSAQKNAVADERRTKLNPTRQSGHMPPETITGSAA